MNFLSFHFPLSEADLFLLLLLVVYAISSGHVVAKFDKDITIPFEQVATFMCPSSQLLLFESLQISLSSNLDYLFEDVPPESNQLRCLLTAGHFVQISTFHHVASEEEILIYFSS